MLVLSCTANWFGIMCNFGCPCERTISTHWSRHRTAEWSEKGKNIMQESKQAWLVWFSKTQMERGMWFYFI